MKLLFSWLTSLRQKGAGDKVKSICIYNQSTYAPLTRPMLENIAHALYRQLSEHYAPFCEAGVPDDISVAMFSTEVPKDAALVILLDDPDVDGALGYHWVLPNGQPVARVFTKPILDNGGTLTVGANSVSCTLSHEILEMVEDPYANAWNDIGEGSNEEDAHEVCDRTEGDSYEIDGISVSNFLGPRAFRDGAGPYDYLGLLKKPFEIRPGGYAIRRRGGPNGTSREIFGDSYPSWKQDVRVKKEFSRAKKRARTGDIK